MGVPEEVDAAPVCLYQTCTVETSTTPNALLTLAIPVCAALLVVHGPATYSTTQATMTQQQLSNAPTGPVQEGQGQGVAAQPHPHQGWSKWAGHWQRPGRQGQEQQFR
jgi:hypothetical protein